jgi:hypothetical protein
LTEARNHIVRLWNHWDDDEAKSIAAMNLFLDVPVAQRRQEMQKLQDDVGTCSDAGPVLAENWLRGQFNMSCKNGSVGVFFTMAPTNPPKVQHLTFRKLTKENARLSAPTGAPAGVSCAAQ